MTYILFYLFSALLYVAVMLTLRKAIEASGVSRRSFRTLAIVGAILSPLLWVMMLAYGIYGIFKRVINKANKDEKLGKS